ncbi:MAG: serine/threonine protein kinase [Planctomycetia bacterium]
MPAPTIDEFWKLLARSRLVDAGAVASLRAAHAQAGPPADVKATAQWLVDRGYLTRWQAKRLAIGDMGPFFLGDYRLLERHERQGDGLLFSARHDPSGRGVSIMLLNPKRCLDLQVWTAIVRRTTAAHQATDPMLSHTWALEQAEGARFVVCETVAGETLAQELARLGPLLPAQAGVLAHHVARAVAEIHAAGGVHGGLSLDALVREPVPPGAPARNGRVRLLQFPLVGDPHAVPLRPAVGTDEELARLGERASFIAPELLLPAQACDARSDVYAIGCILHALLTGSPPCWQGDPQATLRQAAFAGPAALGPPVSSELSALVGYLTARDPDARYQTAGEAAEAIAVCCGIVPAATEPVVVAPPRAEPAWPAAEAAPERAAESAVAWSSATSGPVPGSGRPATTSTTSATLAARRRAARLRMVGAGLAVAVVATVAAFVVSRIDWGGATVGGRSTARREGDRSAVVRERPARDAVPAPPEPAAPTASVETQPPAEPKPVPPPAVEPRQVVIDDPVLPWAAPTAGPAPRLEFLPPGTQLVLLARPAAALAAGEGPLFLKSLGPAAESAARELAAMAGCDLAEIESLQVGWQAGKVDEVIDCYVLRLVESRRVPAEDAARQAAWGATKPKIIDGQTIHKRDEEGTRGYWVPESGGGRTLVAAPGPLLETIVAEAATAPAAGLAASLPKEMETLVGLLDGDRHITLFGSPHYLTHDGRRLLAGPRGRLAETLAGFVGDAVRAAALSLHFGDNAYAELDVVATADAPASKLAPVLATAVGGLEDAAEAYCAALDPAPYGRRLVLRLPRMLGELAANLRAGPEGKGVVLNAYLPPHAAHNLALATELVLAQSPRGAAGPATAAGPPPADDALGRLQKKVTLVFVKDTLEKTIQMISDEIDVPMEIVGPDLQLEGITKNQSFGLDETDKTAEAVLRVVLAKANPDGKLVFVVRKQDGRETIEITTRAAAQKRGDTLPAGQ